MGGGGKLSSSGENTSPDPYTHVWKCPYSLSRFPHPPPPALHFFFLFLFKPMQAITEHEPSTWQSVCFLDPQEFSPGSNGRTTTMGVYVRDLLLGQVGFHLTCPFLHSFFNVYIYIYSWSRRKQLALSHHPIPAVCMICSWDLLFHEWMRNGFDLLPYFGFEIAVLLWHAVPADTSSSDAADRLQPGEDEASDQAIRVHGGVDPARLGGHRPPPAVGEGRPVGLLRAASSPPGLHQGLLPRPPHAPCRRRGSQQGPEPRPWAAEILPAAEPQPRQRQRRQRARPAAQQGEGLAPGEAPGVEVPAEQE